MAVGFTNTVNVGWAADETSSTFPATPAKPSDDVDGTIMDVSQAINDQTAGAFTISYGGTLNVISGPTNAPTLFKSGSQWRLGLSADAATADCNCASGASAQKTALLMTLTGVNTSSPIRDSAIATGTSTAPQCPDTSTSPAQPGDLVVRKVWWHDDGDGSAVTRAGGLHEAGPLHQPGAANGKAIMVDFYVVGSGGHPGTATFGIAASRPWTAETIVYAAASSGAVRVQRMSLLGVN
jgi:hypothetical protein